MHASIAFESCAYRPRASFAGDFEPWHNIIERGRIGMIGGTLLEPKDVDLDILDAKIAEELVNTLNGSTVSDTLADYSLNLLAFITTLR